MIIYVKGQITNSWNSGGTSGGHTPGARPLGGLRYCIGGLNEMILYLILSCLYNLNDMSACLFVYTINVNTAEFRSGSDFLWPPDMTPGRLEFQKLAFYEIRFSSNIFKIQET